MQDISDKRFDEGSLKIGNDGNDFEQFVCEYLGLVLPDDAFVRGLAAGRDGAIDLEGTSSALHCIAECKFVGALAKDNAEARWATVENHLRKNLPLAANGQGAALYRPWLRTCGPVRIYRFATSALAGSAEVSMSVQK